MNSPVFDESKLVLADSVIICSLDSNLTWQIPFTKQQAMILPDQTEVHCFDFDHDALVAMERFATGAGHSYADIALAIFTTVVFRYSSLEEIVVSLPDSEQPCRIPLNGDLSFIELLDQVKSSRQADVPWDDAGVDVRNQSDVETPAHDFILSLDTSPDGVTCRVNWNARHIDRSYIERFGGHFLTVLRAAGSNPDEAIGRIALLPESEFHQIVHEWNNTAGPFATTALIHQNFEARARQTPDAVAVVAHDREFTYKQINDRANRLAHYLQILGIGPNVFVGVCLKRSEEMIIAVLGVLKAGGAYAPLDPAYPKDRLAYMLQDTQAPLVITQSELLERLPQGVTRYVCIDQIAAALTEQSTDDPSALATTDDHAYVIYTSGSTGVPKGVLLRHRPVVNVLDWVSQTFGVTPADRLLFVTSLSFDLSVYDIFGILGAGGSIRVATEDELRDPAILLNTLTAEPITIWDSAPAALAQLVPFLGPRNALRTTRPGGPSLRLVMLSGDWIPVTLPDQVRGAFPNARILSLGGATEAAIWSNWYPIETVEPTWPSIPYGKPIRNARYHILDKHLQPVPIGVVGELHIGGDVLADGYLNRGELTAERFIPDPFTACIGARLYKTGDLARYMPDGNIEFLGRIDNQVKIRGFRVEAGEIEAVITQIPAVQDAVVKPFKDTSSQNYLVAFVVLRAGQAISAAEITRHLQTKLPEYMVPTQIAFLDALPLTPNGKVDRGALMPPETNRAARGYEEPLDAIEIGIAEIWTDVLGGDKVGRSDNFFERGGHSLRAAQALARLEEKFDVELRLPSMFENPNLAAFADVIRKASRIASRQLIARKPGLNHAPASLIQQRFWFLDRNIADRTIYNVADAIRIQGPLNVPALRKAWQALVDRQESLRTTFENADGWPEQVVHPPMVVALPLLDLSQRGDAEGEARRLIAQDARQPFDVANGPLWRARIIKLSADQHLLCWTIHHIIVDESSRAILLHDLWEAYANAVRGRSANLPELPIRYIDYSVWQRDQVTPEAIAFWRKQLKATPPPLVPPHPLPRPAIRSFQGRTVAFPIPSAVSRVVQSLSRQTGVTPYIIWLATYQTFLLRCTGQTDICIGSPVSTRPGAVRDVAGCFVNTLVLRTDLAGDPLFRELLGKSRETLLGALQYGDVPFEKLVEELRPERVPGGHPLFQSLFIYQAEDLRGGTTADGLTWQHDGMERIGAKFDFTLTIEEQHEQSTGFIEYAHDLYDAETISRYVARFLTLLEGIAARPEAKLSELPLLPEAERDLVLYQFNATEFDYPRELCVHQLVEAQAERTPDVIAFDFKGTTLTFRELNERANRLAHHLRGLGVKPDTLVGLCVERSLDLPIAMLGILKSGGAYLPLDPDFPPDRLSFYLSDSKSPIIVAHHHFLDNLPVESLTQVCIDKDAETIASNPATNPVNVTRPSDMIYVLYTSGSTGRPNGVALQHQSLVNLFWTFKERPGLRADDTIFSITTLSFDIHTVETWLPMVMGARSIIVPRDAALNGQKLADMVQDYNATIMQSTPATWRLLMSAGWKGKADLRIWCGGEPLTAELHQQLSERVGELWNVYGPTETAVWSVIHKTRPTDQIMYIGKPIANTQIYLLDPQRQPVPLGCVGEIWIAGDGLARGYLGREELTQARFLPDPFSRKPGNRMYKTGDLGRIHPDGSIECLGRVDHQVKVRGFRIELNEIERVLEEHDGLAQVVVTARTDDEFAAMIHAYFRCEPGHAPTPADLRKFAQGRLPDYMIPATFTKLDEFPQTPNGKVDRKALPAPTIEAAAIVADRVFVAPSNDAERGLLAIWEEVLGIKPLSVTDNFHEVGGHSLLAAVLMSRIESRLGHRLSLEVLFEHPTVRSLAEALNRKLELGSGSMVPLQTGGSQPPLFLIAGVGGHVFAFHKFARELGSDYPVYGMKAIGINGDEPPLERFEDIASRYVKEILAECPEGPYVLGGYSVGARIAMEVALQLQALGKDVPRLLVVDMFAPGYPKPYSLLRRIGIHSLRFLKLPFRKKWAYARERCRRLLQRVNVEVFQDVMVKQLDVAPQKILADVGNALLRGNERYMPVRKYKGKVVLIQSDVIEEWEEAVERVDFQGWVPWSTEPVEEHTLRAAHLDMFKDHVQPELARIVRQVIHDVKDETALTALTR